MSMPFPPDDLPAYEDSPLVEEETRAKVPPRYRVLIHNDDFTTMEFVVRVLIELFRKSHAEANFIMLTVHQKGVGACGEYSRDVAETKVAQVTQLAREHGHPLLCTLEKS
jgi:ATP-dependent Clp protease adaptor protein ClpS